MTTFLDLIKDTDFLNYVEKRLNSKETDKSYSLTGVIPKLYRYRSFSRYAVDDIINCQNTATSIGDFNDLFDGAIQSFSTLEERKFAAEKEWKELNEFYKTAGIHKDAMDQDSFMQLQMKAVKRELRQNFRLLDYLGTYVCCYSANNTSTLMWSHYANSNTGICVEYDFNDSKLSKLIFPVKYTRTPVDLQDLLSDEKDSVYKYPIDAAVLCAALNKSTVWNYEEEWRSVLVPLLEHGSNKARRIPMLSPGKPKSISFGYHFFKPLFYYNFDDSKEKESINQRINETDRLFKYIEENNIPISISVPSGDGFNLKPKEVSIESLKNLFDYHFKKRSLMRIGLYHVVHDNLLDLVGY